MNLSKLLELEAKQDFDDVNAIRSSHVRSFFDEWIVTGLLGRGSFGNVYQIIKPQDGMTAQYCALKICQVANPEDAEIRLQEIETQKLLDGHMNAVQIEDYALISRQPPRVSYLIIRMELLEPLPDTGMTEREVVRMGIDICRVLEKCASMEPKLIHCDIKPANILVAPDGRYKLGDFGTAKTLQATMTYTGNRGTPLYMAPEVATYTGYDSRCDIFSLGYTMLTMLNGGQHPCQDAGERVDILREMYSSRKLPQIKGVGSGLMKILRKMCEPNLAARYSRASAVRRDLELYIRKKEEIERVAFLEAERQAEIARKKGKVEREKNIRIAEESLKKAQSYLDTAKNTPGGTARRLSELETNAERAALVLRYVIGGDTLEEARRKANSGNAKPAADFRSRRRWWIGGAAVLVVLVTLLAVILPLKNQENNDGQLSLQSEHASSAVSSAGKESYKTERYRDFVFELTEDGKGYILKDYVGKSLAAPKVPDMFNFKPVVRIDDKAFRDCDSIIGVKIPKDTEVNLKQAFEGCNRLEYVERNDSLTVFSFYNDSDEGITADNALEYYRNFVFAPTADGMGYILKGYDGRDLESVRIPEVFNFKPVVKIDDRVFYNADNIVGIVIPDSVEVIGESAFEGCAKLRSLKIGDGVKELGSRAFASCTGLVDAELLFSSASIGEDIFDDCGSLSRIEISEGIAQTGNNIFDRCDNLRYVQIYVGCTRLNCNLFRDCSELTEINIPRSVKEIYNMSALGAKATVYAPYEPEYYEGYTGDIACNWVVVD